MKKVIFIWFILTIFIAKSQISSEDFLQFPATKVGSKDSVTFIVRNHYSHPIQIDSLIFYNSAFDCHTKSLTIPASDSIPITIYFIPRQNVFYNSIMLLKTRTNKVYPIKISSLGRYDDFYQEFTFNLFDEELKIALSNYLANHTSLGYKLARQKMFETIDDLGNDTIECVYTGRKIVTQTIPNVNIDHFNTEHTWPQETFDSQEPMRSDLYNLYPTDEYANAKRANYPFGIVTSNKMWENGGSILGRNSLGQIVFEPRNQHKGNVARSIFYFIIRYKQNYGDFLDSIQEDILRNWNIIDPVDEREKQRNDSIAFYQGKRNPFIDHPEFVERIGKFSSNAIRPKIAQVEIFPFFNNPDTIFTNVTANLKFVLINFGDTSFQINSINLSNSDLHIVNYPRSISPHSFGLVEIIVDTKSTGILESVIEVQGYGATIRKTLSIHSVNQYNSRFEIEQNSFSLFWENVNKTLDVIVTEELSPSYLQIYNLYGQPLLSYELKTGTNKLNLNYVTKGLFFVALRAKDYSPKVIPILIY
ncbi:MAG: endonuclease I family protein [Candidatus Kapaibacteriales bacterium]